MSLWKKGSLPALLPAPTFPSATLLTASPSSHPHLSPIPHHYLPTLIYPRPAPSPHVVYPLPPDLRTCGGPCASAIGSFTGRHRQSINLEMRKQGCKGVAVPFLCYLDLHTPPPPFCSMMALLNGVVFQKLNQPDTATTNFDDSAQ